MALSISEETYKIKVPSENTITTNKLMRNVMKPIYVAGNYVAVVVLYCYPGSRKQMVSKTKSRRVLNERSYLVNS